MLIKATRIGESLVLCWGIYIPQHGRIFTPGRIAPERAESLPSPYVCTVSGWGHGHRERLSLSYLGDLSWANFMFCQSSLISPASRCLQKPVSATLNIFRYPKRTVWLPAAPVSGQQTLNPGDTHSRLGIYGCARRSQLAVFHYHSHDPQHFIRHCYTHSRMSGPVPEATKPADQYRLPTNVKPTHYDLTIRTDLQELKFDGYVTAQCVASGHQYSFALTMR